MGLLDPEYLSGLDHATLYRMRAAAKAEEEQRQLAAYEHRAFSREATRENPLMALSLLAAAPLYQGGKALGLIKSRTPASMFQLGQGLLGIGEGLYGRP